jgi:hypothetical protein
MERPSGDEVRRAARAVVLGALLGLVLLSVAGRRLRGPAGPAGTGSGQSLR